MNLPTALAGGGFLLTLLVGGPVRQSEAAANNSGPNSTVVVGTLKAANPAGTEFEVFQQGGYLRQLKVGRSSKVLFAGFPNKADRKPTAGYGVKATTTKDGALKSITFTPPVDEVKPLGEERLTMSLTELYEATDADDDDAVSYEEYSSAIYYSPKHGPDRFRKADTDGNGLMSAQEFADELSHVSWWALSRRSPSEWFTFADGDRDGELSVAEFTKICASSGHAKEIFKRSDKDKSGALSKTESESYVRSVTHGAAKAKKKQKSDRE